jgi:hypothetical protein
MNTPEAVDNIYAGNWLRSSLLPIFPSFFVL